MYKSARKRQGLSTEEAAFRLHIATRTLVNYESHLRVPPPDVVMEMSREYLMPEMTQRYCRECCPIGQVYSYEVLTTIDMGLAAVMLKLRSELMEVKDVLNTLLDITVNKRTRSDFSDEEWDLYCRGLHELLDVEHNIEILKLSLGQMLGPDPVVALVAEHNQKCRDRGYIDRKKPPKAAQKMICS